MKKLTLIAFAVLAVSTVAFAQVEKGDINVSGSLSFTKVSDFDGAGIIEGKAGYYFSQNFEAGGVLNIQLGETAVTGLGPYATYNFLTQDAKLLPYAGGNLLFMFSENVSATALGVNGGAKYFINESVNIDAGLALYKSFGDLDGSLFVMRVGIGFLLGSLK